MQPIIEYILNNKAWIFSGIGVLALTGLIWLVKHLFPYKPPHIIDKNEAKSKRNVHHNSLKPHQFFRSIELRNNSISLGNDTIFLKSICTVSINKEDIRTTDQKSFDAEEHGTQAGILLLGWVVSLLCLIYSGIEFGLSYLGAEGFISVPNQEKLFNTSLSVFILIPILLIYWVIKHALRARFANPIWEWTLRLGTLDGREFSIVCRTPNIIELKHSIERNIVDETNGVCLSFNIDNKIMLEKTLVNAKTKYQTDFGCLVSNSTKSIQKVESAPDLRWTIDGDGTATDHINRLTWVQAPWGMKWDGQRFHEKPIEISWVDAKNLFGEGRSAGSFTGLGVLTDEDYQDSDVKNGYTRGTCRINFAGYHDWRLPTAAEWRTIQFLSSSAYPDLDFNTREKFQTLLFPEKNASQAFWSATGKRHPYMCEQVDMGKLQGLKRLFGILKILGAKLNGYLSQKIYGDSAYTAWIMSFERSIDLDGGQRHPVLFVRSL